MVVVDVHKKEIEALDKLMEDAKVSVLQGYILGTLRVKIADALKKELMKANKEAAKKILGEEKGCQCESCKEKKKDDK